MLSVSELAELHNMTVEELANLFLTFTPSGVVLHKEGDPYVKRDFVDHVVDIETGKVVMQGKPLSRRTLGYMDEALYNLYQTTQTTEYIATIEHGLNILPAAAMYVGEYAFGVGTFGEGPFGGSHLLEIPVRLEVVGWNTAMIYTIPKFAGYSILNKIGKTVYALSSPDSKTTLTLLLR